MPPGLKRHVAQHCDLHLTRHDARCYDGNTLTKRYLMRLDKERNDEAQKLYDGLHCKTKQTLGEASETSQRG